MEPLRLSQFSFFWRIVACVQPPLGYLAAAVLIFGEVDRVVLHYPDALPLALPDEMIAHDSTYVRIPCSAGKWSGAVFCRPQESHIMNLGVMLHLTVRQLVPVYRGLCPVHPSPMCLHVPSGHLNVIFRTWDPYPQSSAL